MRSERGVISREVQSRAHVLLTRPAGAAGRPGEGAVAQRWIAAVLVQGKRKRVTSAGKSNHAIALTGVKRTRPPAASPSQESGSGS